MREIEVKGRTIQINPLKFSDVRSLTRQGLSVTHMAPHNAVSVIMAHMECALSDDELAILDDLDYSDPEIKAVYEAILAETYGSPGEEKNS